MMWINEDNEKSHFLNHWLVFEKHFDVFDHQIYCVCCTFTLKIKPGESFSPSYSHTCWNMVISYYMYVPILANLLNTIIKPLEDILSHVQLIWVLNRFDEVSTLPAVDKVHCTYVLPISSHISEYSASIFFLFSLLFLEITINILKHRF